jgi:PAS domain S-box-containing protein
MNPSGIDANKSVAHRSSGLPQKYLQRYALAILSAGVALGMSLLLEHFQFRVPSALLLLFAVAISSWFGGPGPAVLAVILSTVSFYWYFVEPVRTIYIYPSEIPYFALFVAFAMLLSWFGVVRRRVEEELREGETRFRAFVDHAADAFFVLDGQQQGRVLDVNRQACESLGYTREELIGMVPRDFDPDVDATLLQGIRERIAAGEVCTFETRHRRKDGTGFPVEVRVRPLWHGGRRIHLALARDISERKRTEEELHRLNRELRAISNCNQTLLRAADEQSLLTEICRIVCEDAGYRMAWVGYTEHDEAKSVRPVAWAGAEEGYLALAGITWADTERGRGPGGTAIRSGKSCYTQDYATDPGFAPWRVSALDRGFRSGIVLPLKEEHAKAFGCLCIYSAQPNAFTSEEIRLLEEMTADLAFGIVTLRSREARKQAEQEIALLSFALDNVREAAFLVGETGRFRYVNEEASCVLGYSREELLGMAVPDIDPEFPAGHWPDHWRDLKTLRSLSFESRHRTRDGRIFPVEISANYFEYEAQAYVLALAQDITERKRAEQSLRRSEAYLNEAQRLTHTGSWAYDPAGGPIYWSEEMFRIYAVDPQQGFPTRAQRDTRIHPEDLENVRQARHEMLHKKVDSEFEHRIVLPDGRVRHVHVLGHPVLNPAGEVLETVGTTVDITERKRAEEMLRERADLLNLTHDTIFVMDIEGVIGYWNRGAEEQYGWTAEQAVGRVVHDLLKTVFLMPLAEIKAEVIRANRWEGELVHTRKDGTQAVVASRWALQRDSKGAPVAILETNNDVTERKHAEEALRQSEAYLTEAQRLSHTGSWAFDVATGKYIYWSEELFRIFGFDPQEGVGTLEEVIRRFHPEDLNRWKENFERSLREKVDTSCECRFVIPDGTVKFFHLVRHPVLSDAGEVVQLVGTTMDITDRKRAEQELHESETRFRTFVDHAGDAFLVYDLEHRTIVDVNREACESLGYTRQDLIGQTPLSFHPDSYHAEMESIAERAVAGETVIDTHWHRRKDGTVFPVEVHTSLVSYAGRRFLLMIARDISDRLRAEKELRESEQRYRTLFDKANDAIFLENERDEIIEVNQRACALLGYSREELLRMKVPDLQAPEVRGQVGSVIHGETEKHRDASFEGIDLHRSGRQIPVDVTNTRISDRGQELILSIVRDISERKRAEEQRERLRQLEAELAHMNRVSIVGELGASLAHELNQPITGAITSADACLRWLAREPPELERARAATMRVKKDGTRAAEIINRLRAFYKKGAPSHREAINVQEVVNEIGVLLRNEATRHSVTIRTELPTELPKILADRVQLQQVFMNLMLNAIEAMQHTGGELTIRSQRTDHDMLLISISDTGVGLPTEGADQIFDAFFTTKPQGTGMGLAITRSIVEAHGGRLWASPNAERGTTFRFTLFADAGAMNEQS